MLDSLQDFPQKKVEKETVIEYGFNAIQLHSIEAGMHAANIASAAIFEATGFVKEGLLKEEFHFRCHFLIPLSTRSCSKAVFFFSGKKSENDHTVAASEFIGQLLISSRLVQPFFFVYKVFEFMFTVSGQVYISAEGAVLFLTHDHGVLPVAVQSQYFNCFGIFHFERKLHFAIIFRFVVSLLYHFINFSCVNAAKIVYRPFRQKNYYTQLNSRFGER
jgi:hypothetical protein